MVHRICLLSSLVLAWSACGGSASSVFDDSGGGSASASGAGGGDAFGNSGGGAASLAACATDHAAAVQAPVDLVVVMDRSDSMADASKWAACSAALATFFGDPSTKGLRASLTFLPWVAPGRLSTQQNPLFSCNASDYTAPQVAVTALPSAAFAPVITSQKLQFGTPTLASLQGAHAYAAQLQAVDAAAHVAMVLATDGLPYGCAPKTNTVATVAQEAASALAKDRIPTYVIGVGSATSNLDAIASGGGTGKAILVQTSDAEQIAQSFLGALAQIRGALSCRYAIPSPSGGRAIDFDAVNVVYTGAQGPTTLGYSADCADTSGWRYDDRTHPTEIELCAASCASAQAAAGALDIVYGCATAGLK